VIGLSLSSQPRNNPKSEVTQCINAKSSLSQIRSVLKNCFLTNRTIRGMVRFRLRIGARTKATF